MTWDGGAAAPPPVDATVPAADDVARVVDAYLNDAHRQRVLMGETCAALHVAVGSAATILGSSFGVPGAAVAAGLGLASGIAVGLYSADHYMDGQNRAATAVMTGLLAGVQGFMSGLMAQIGLLPAMACNGVGGLAAGFIGGSLRSSQSLQARGEFEDLQRHVEQTLTVERMVRAAQDRTRAGPAPETRVEPDFVTVGGIRVPRGGRPQPCER